MTQGQIGHPLARSPQRDPPFPAEGVDLAGAAQLHDIKVTERGIEQLRWALPDTDVS